MRRRKETKIKGNRQKTATNVVHKIPASSITTLNVDGLNSPIERERDCHGGLKKQTQLCGVCKKPTSSVKTHVLIE